MFNACRAAQYIVGCLGKANKYFSLSHAGLIPIMVAVEHVSKVVTVLRK